MGRLVIGRGVGEGVRIGRDVVVKVSQIRLDGTVRIAIEAPEDVAVSRIELGREVHEHMIAERASVSAANRLLDQAPWSRVVDPAEVGPDGRCPACGGEYEDCGCPSPSDPEMIYRISVPDGVYEALPLSAIPVLLALGTSMVGSSGGGSGPTTTQDG